MEAVRKKIKARLRDERCENCAYNKESIFSIIGKPKIDDNIKKRIHCKRHNHLKKWDAWCKYYIKE